MMKDANQRRRIEAVLGREVIDRAEDHIRPV